MPAHERAPDPMTLEQAEDVVREVESRFSHPGAIPSTGERLLACSAVLVVVEAMKRCGWRVSPPLREVAH
jgi:hypothetical protein